MPFFTATTPGTSIAMDSAVTVSMAVLAKSDSITVPVIVCTLMDEASTPALSTTRAFTEAVIARSSMQAPELSWPRA
jgi:hypothetical protein